MRYTITPEQLNRLIEFAEDDRAEMDFDAIEALNYLHQAVQRHAMKRLSGAMKRNEMLNERLTRFQERNRQKYLNGDFGDTNLDSLVFAKATLYQLQRYDTTNLTRFKFLLIIYRMYATWLYSHKERLFVEEPQAREWGPQFYRIDQNINVKLKASYDDYKALAEKSPAKAAFCRDYIAEYHDQPYEFFHDTVFRSAPFLNAHKNNNNGKWNKHFSLVDIFLWRESLEPAGAAKTKQQ